MSSLENKAKNKGGLHCGVVVDKKRQDKWGSWILGYKQWWVEEEVIKIVGRIVVRKKETIEWRVGVIKDAKRKRGEADDLKMSE